MTEAAEHSKLDTNARADKSEPVDFDTRDLFAGRSEIRIAHDKAVYRLRITRAGKLILNK